MLSDLPKDVRFEAVREIRTNVPCKDARAAEKNVDLWLDQEQKR